MKLPYFNAKNFDRFLTLIAILLVAATVWLLVGCNGQLNSGNGPKKMSFVVIMHNDDIGYAASMTVSWWTESTVTGSEWRDIPGGGESAFVMGAVPDGFMVQALGWSSSPSDGLGWGRPEYFGGNVFHIHYPSGWSRVEKLGN